MLQRPDGPTDLICPFHLKPMSEVCKACPLWVCAKGADPQSGEDIYEFRCSFSWFPIFAGSAALNTAQAAASCDKAASAITEFKESMERANAIGLALMAGDRNQKRIEHDTDKDI